MIAILSALAEEQVGLVECMTRVECVEHAGRTFWLGHLDGQEVVLTLSRIGKVAAALTATALIAKWGVQRMVFTGVAGGTGPGVAVGDVVVGSHYLQHDMDASPLFPRYEIPLTGQSLFPANPLLLEAACAAVREVQLDLRGGRYRADLHCGLIASGDRFVSASSEVHALLAAAAASGFHPLAVEMEGAAVAQVCADYQVPFVAIRTISDRADDTAHVDFPQFVQETASVYALAIVRKMLRLL
ncbi:aminodeoxyfutalosine nucleosidase [Comamonadaceae bacterium OS-4]|nr:aminodeoxyfutalosine nucleosidase [Comamonadaceae bacterium OS-4]